MIYQQIRLPHPLAVGSFATQASVVALDERVTTLEHMTVARAGMRKTAPLNLGTLTQTWVSIDGYASQIYTSAIGAGYSLNNGALTVDVPDDYNYIVSIEFGCTSDNNSSRPITKRFLEVACYSILVRILKAYRPLSAYL